MSESLMEKLAEISIQIFTIGRLYGIKKLENLSTELNSLFVNIAQRDWHTGTPPENGTYVCRMKNDFAKWLVLNFKNGIWNVDGTSQSFADVGYNDCIEKWMKITEEEET